MIKLLLTIIIITCISTYATAQYSPLVLNKRYNVTATDFTVDAMGYIYLVTPTAQLKKINEKGDSVAVYNLSKRYGKLTSIDATNPLKVLLYYGDYATVIVVDRLLNVTNKIDLRKYNIYQTKTVATSYDGQMWLYDEQAAVLKKISEDGKITMQSVDFRQLYTNPPAPVKIIDNDQTVYLYDPKVGVKLMDYYGASKAAIPLLNWTSIYAMNKNIYGLKNDSIVKYTNGSIITNALPNGIKPIKMVVAANKIYFLYKGYILAYDDK